MNVKKIPHDYEIDRKTIIMKVYRCINNNYYRNSSYTYCINLPESFKYIIISFGCYI